MITQDAVATAIGGGFIGFPFNPSHNAANGFLLCGGTTSGMLSMSAYATQQPNIVDIHEYPYVAGSPVQSEAKIDFDDIGQYLAAWNVQSSIVVVGETHSNTNNGGKTCEGSGPPTASTETVAGYNLSALAGHSVVFRPWAQLHAPSGNCFIYPDRQRVNYNGSGPYTPTQQ